MPQPLIDITGKRYGKYTVVSKVEGRKSYWNCKCDCGTERPVFAPDLKRGASTSCGCVPHIATPEQIERAKVSKELTLANRKKRQANALARAEVKWKERQAKADAAAAAAAEAKIRATEPALKNVAPGFKVKSGMVERYGVPVPADTPMIAVELMCYRDNAMLKAKGAKVEVPEFHFRKAFALMWPKFAWNSWCDMMMQAWCNYKIICVIGHSRASKTYFFAHLAFLDYLSSSDNTATTLTTTKFDALKTRLWADMMGAIDSIENQSMRDSVHNLFRITNTSNEMKVSSSSKTVLGDDKFMIQGVATDSADKSAGKIRGQHADRRRIIGDEAQDIAEAIYKAIANAVSAPDFKGVLLSNPVEKLSEFGNWCKPKNGWGSVHHTDLCWETETPNGICLHFDGLQSPNIKAGKTIFPFLLTQEYVDFIKDKFGEDSVEWWMYIRGFFPPDGVVARVWPSATIEKAMKGQVFDFPPKMWASLDPAYDFDDCILTLAELGRVTGVGPRLNMVKQFKIKYAEGPNSPTKDRQIADEVQRICVQHGVDPSCYIQDTTGNGRSVFALLHESWSREIHKLEYGGAATERPMRLNDTKPANEQVKYRVSEIWFRASFLAGDGILCGLSNLDPKTVEDLSSRRYVIKQGNDTKLMVVEPKEEMKKRLGRSPDYGDSLCQFGELMYLKGMVGELPSKPKNNWAQAKEKAIAAAAVYAENAEYSY